VIKLFWVRITITVRVFTLDLLGIQSTSITDITYLLREDLTSLLI
jgi:hypothetical protein